MKNLDHYIEAEQPDNKDKGEDCMDIAHRKQEVELKDKCDRCFAVDVELFKDGRNWLCGNCLDELETMKGDKQ